MGLSIGHRAYTGDKVDLLSQRSIQAEGTSKQNKALRVYDVISLGLRIAERSFNGAQFMNLEP